MLVKAFPWLRGINFDQPHVVSLAGVISGVENVGGDMFESVPKADAAFLKVGSKKKILSLTGKLKYSFLELILVSQ